MGGSGASRSGVSWTDVLCTGSRAEDNRLVGLTALVVINKSLIPIHITLNDVWHCVHF